MTKASSRTRLFVGITSTFLLLGCVDTSDPELFTPVISSPQIGQTGQNIKVYTLSINASDGSVSYEEGNLFDGEVTVNSKALFLDGTLPISKDQNNTPLIYVSGLEIGSEQKIVLIPTTIRDFIQDYTLEYQGNAHVTVVDAGQIFDGQMDSTVLVSSVSGYTSSSIELSNLFDATMTSGQTVTYESNGNEKVSVAGLSVNGGFIVSNDTTTANSTGFGSPQSAFEVASSGIDVVGHIAGPNAEELGIIGSIHTGDQIALFSLSGAR